MSTSSPSSSSLPAKAPAGKKPLTFGDFVAGSYRAWGKRKAEGIIRLAVKSHLIEFCGQQRFIIA
jgi:hypothetical protein